jgi:hypothetical protein
MGRNPNGIFPAGPDMVRAAREFKSCGQWSDSDICLCWKLSTGQNVGIIEITSKYLILVEL